MENGIPVCVGAMESLVMYIPVLKYWRFRDKMVEVRKAGAMGIEIPAYVFRTALKINGYRYDCWGAKRGHVLMTFHWRFKGNIKIVKVRRQALWVFGIRNSNELLKRLWDYSSDIIFWTQKYPPAVRMFAFLIRVSIYFEYEYLFISSYVTFSSFVCFFFSSQPRWQYFNLNLTLNLVSISLPFSIFVSRSVSISISLSFSISISVSISKSQATAYYLLSCVSYISVLVYSYVDSSLKVYNEGDVEFQPHSLEISRSFSFWICISISTVLSLAISFPFSFWICLSISFSISYHSQYQSQPHSHYVAISVSFSF